MDVCERVEWASWVSESEKVRESERMRERESENENERDGEVCRWFDWSYFWFIQIQLILHMNDIELIYEHY